MAQPEKKAFSHFRETCVFKPSAREQKLIEHILAKTDYAEIDLLKARFNMLCEMLSVQLANYSFKTLVVKDE